MWAIAAVTALSLVVASAAGAHAQTAPDMPMAAPTRALGADTAAVLPPGQGLWALSASAAPGLAESTLGLDWGLAGGGQLRLRASGHGSPAPGRPAGAVGEVGYKQQLASSQLAALAAGALVAVTTTPTGPTLDLVASAPLTATTAVGLVTIMPEIRLEAIGMPAGGWVAGLAICSQTPLPGPWQALVGLRPAFRFGRAFSLTGGVGARYALAPDKHLDLTLGSLNTASADAGDGLLSLTGFVGF